ncbi:MAG: DNA-binding transcriptional regulator [Planctomycetes bacterium]|nr:DNA-binding transcriptional regulator [Planctomycetota bacterium]
MSLSRPNKVALIFPLRPGPWPEIVRGVYRYAAKQDPSWQLALHTHDNSSVALAGNPDGVIAMIRTPQTADALAAWGGPVVDTGADLKTHPFPRVLLDSEEIGRLAAEHLLRLGPRRFAFVGNCESLAGDRLRAGFTARLGEAGQGCETPPPGAFDDPYSERPTSRVEAATWLSGLQRPAAVFASHDALAHRLIEVCGSAELRVPQDVAILGLLNDEFLCLTSQPPLSSISVPLAGMGYEAAQVLRGLMAGGCPPTSPLVLPPGEVVARRSTDGGAVADPQLSSALCYIHDHLDEPIGVDDIAQAGGVSRSSLERRFRSSLGRGPLAELIRLRLEYAKRMLIESTLSVKQIAAAAGFHDTRHLSVTFRAKIGMSPIEYRDCFRPV